VQIGGEGEQIGEGSHARQLGASMQFGAYISVKWLCEHRWRKSVLGIRYSLSRYYLGA